MNKERRECIVMETRAMNDLGFGVNHVRDSL